jgi:formylglycine-generating enzyme required for sulfatase activity
MLYYVLLVLAKGPAGALAVLFSLSPLSAWVLSLFLAAPLPLPTSLPIVTSPAPDGPLPFTACYVPAAAANVPAAVGNVPMCLVPTRTLDTCLGPVRDQCERSTVREFLLDRTHVTAAAYESCVAAGVCKERHMNRFDESDFCNCAGPGRGDHPANCINIEGAEEYCTWVGKRLPTVREWLSAAGAPDGRTYPWGSQPPDCSRANYHNEAGRGCGKAYTVPVGSLPGAMSAFGMVDMAGNIMQWTSSFVDPASATGGEEDEEMLRYVGGGSFADTPELLRSRVVSVDEGESDGVGLGLRCALSPRP